MRDWTAIEKLYVQGDVSLRELAQRQEIPLSTLKKHAWADRWSEKRRVYHAQKARAEPEADSGKGGGELDKLICATDRLTEAALRALEDEKQFCRWIVSDGGGAAKSTEERVFQKIDTKSLKEMAGVLKELTELTRDFYGLPAPADAAAARLAEEKLALDRQKLDAAQHQEEPQEIRVVIDEEAEALSE